MSRLDFQSEAISWSASQAVCELLLGRLTRIIHATCQPAASYRIGRCCRRLVRSAAMHSFPEPKAPRRSPPDSSAMLQRAPLYDPQVRTAPIRRLKFGP